MPVGDLSKLIRVDLVHRDIIGLLVALDGNLSGHPTNGSHLAPGYLTLGLDPRCLTLKAYLWHV